MELEIDTTNKTFLMPSERESVWTMHKLSGLSATQVALIDDFVEGPDNKVTLPKPYRFKPGHCLELPVFTRGRVSSDNGKPFVVELKAFRQMEVGGQAYSDIVPMGTVIIPISLFVARVYEAIGW